MNYNKLSISDVGLSYRGKVNVFIRKKEHVLKSYEYHNEGKMPLFEFLAKCLVGNYESSGRINCLRGFGVGAGGLEIPLFGNKSVPISSYSYVGANDNGATVRYIFVIPGSYFVEHLNTPLKILKLYSEAYKEYSDIDMYSAEVELDTGILVDDTSKNVLVVWDLIVANGDSSSLTAAPADIDPPIAGPSEGNE